MKQIAEKCPKAWELAQKECQFGHIKGAFQVIGNDSFLISFGYLVLEFFPKYGIHINLNTEIKTFNLHGMMINDKEYSEGKTYNGPKDLIKGAFEILENILEDK